MCVILHTKLDVYKCVVKKPVPLTENAHTGWIYSILVVKMRELFGQSLTMAQLREIQAGRSGDDVLALLWEIKRLHVVLRRADQLASMVRY